MERLWTPWRRAYLDADASRSAEECFLCAAAAAEDDKGHLILWRGSNVFALLNLYPYNSGHLMVAPYLHTGDLARLDRHIAAELMHATQRSVDALQRAYQPDAFNIGMNLGKPAGAGVPDHLHMHVVPRWNGDTNFMPVTAETKVLPETLDQTYDRLAPHFQS